MAEHIKVKFYARVVPQSISLVMLVYQRSAVC